MEPFVNCDEVLLTTELVSLHLSCNLLILLFPRTGFLSFRRKTNICNEDGDCISDSDCFSHLPSYSWCPHLSPSSYPALLSSEEPAFPFWALAHVLPLPTETFLFYLCLVDFCSSLRKNCASSENLL